MPFSTSLVPGFDVAVHVVLDETVIRWSASSRICRSVARCAGASFSASCRRSTSILRLLKPMTGALGSFVSDAQWGSRKWAPAGPHRSAKQHARFWTRFCPRLVIGRSMCSYFGSRRERRAGRQLNTAFRRNNSSWLLPQDLPELSPVGVSLVRVPPRASGGHLLAD